MTFFMKRLFAAILFSAVICLPTAAQARYGAAFDLSIHHGDGVVGANVRRDLAKQTLAVRIRPGHAAVFSIQLRRVYGEPRLRVKMYGCGGGELFGVRWSPRTEPM
jgi:hypothetical protein